MKGPHGPKRPVSLSFIILYCVAFTSKPNTRTIVYIASIYIYIYTTTTVYYGGLVPLHLEQGHLRRPPHHYQKAGSLLIKI